MSMPDAHGSQKNASDPQDLKLQNAVSCHVDAKIPTRVLCKISQC